MPFQIIRDDITKVKADAIVNSANPRPVCGSGSDTAIYLAAGPEELLKERQKIGRISRGEAAVTPALKLPARFIIHTVGPIWEGGNHGEFDILHSCYRKSLMLAEQLNCKSIAFPLIATGNYGFPRDRALQIALEEFENHLKDYDREIILVVFDPATYQISEKMQRGIERYIDENYVRERLEEEYKAPSIGGIPDFSSPSGKDAFFNERELFEDAAPMEAANVPRPPQYSASSKPERRRLFSRRGKKKSLEYAMDHLDETFQQRLLRMIDEKGMADPEVYKKANLDRKLFSKIRCNKDYVPKKKTALALALALQLNLDDTKDLLGSAGLALSNSKKADVIISFCIENEIYDIFEINALLFQYEQPLLG